MRKWLAEAMIIVALIGILIAFGFGLQTATSNLLPPGWDQYKYFVPPDWLERTVLGVLLLVAFLIHGNLRSAVDG
jgi:ABC-type antimicrobial peptide transport system permease subunit